MTVSIRPCGCKGITTSAPNFDTQIVMINQACEHGYGEWDSIAATIGVPSITLGGFITSVINCVTDMRERGQYTNHVNLWFAGYAEQRSHSDMMAAVEFDDRGRINLLWDPCPVLVGSFHGRVWLVEWMLSQVTEMSPGNSGDSVVN